MKARCSRPTRDLARGLGISTMAKFDMMKMQNIFISKAYPAIERLGV